MPQVSLWLCRIVPPPFIEPQNACNIGQLGEVGNNSLQRVGGGAGGVCVGPPFKCHSVQLVPSLYWESCCVEPRGLQN